MLEPLKIMLSNVVWALEAPLSLFIRKKSPVNNGDGVYCRDPWSYAGD